jgi:hypothetical protein
MNTPPVPVPESTVIAVTPLTPKQESAHIEAATVAAAAHVESTIKTEAGQRRVNIVWELTQAFIAVGIVTANLIVGVAMSLSKTPANEFPFVLSSSMFLVIGFYFSRTNHAAIGGVGAKTQAPYEGR